MYGIVRQMTLRQRLVALVAIAIVPGVAALLVFIVAFHQERQREVREQALRTSEIIALEMSRIVSGAGSVLETLAVAPAVRALSPSCPAYLAELTSRLPNLAGIAVAETDGRLRCATAAFASADLAAKDYFREAAGRDGLVVGGYAPGTGGRPGMLPIALRIDAGAGPRMLVTAIDLDWLGARLRERDLAAGSAVSVADRDGVILAREPDAEDFVGKRLSEPAMVLAHARIPGTVELTSPDGTQRIVGYQPAGSALSDLFVGVGFSTDAAFAPMPARARLRPSCSPGRSATACSGGRSAASSTPSRAGAPATRPRGSASPRTRASSRSSRRQSTSTWTASSPSAPRAPRPRSGGRSSSSR